MTLRSNRKDRHFAARRHVQFSIFVSTDVSAKESKLDIVYNAVRNAGRAIENEQAALDHKLAEVRKRRMDTWDGYIPLIMPIALELGYVAQAVTPDWPPWAGGEGRCRSLVELDLIPDNSYCHRIECAQGV